MLEELTILGEEVKEDIRQMRGQTQELKDVLIKEVEIIIRWRNNAENLSEKLTLLDLDKLTRLHIYGDIYIRALARLRESAEEYLEQPVELDSDNVLFGGGRKRRAMREMPAVPLTRSHKGRF